MPSVYDDAPSLQLPESPPIEFFFFKQKTAYEIFDELMVNIKTEICHNIFRSASSLMAFENFLRSVPQQTMHQSTSAFGGSTTTATSQPQAQAGPSQGSDIVSEAAAAVEKARPVR